MKIYIDCCVPAQTSCLVKKYIPDTWAKMFSENQIIGFLMNHSSRGNQNSQKLKIDQRILRWAWSKMSVASLVT